MIASQENDAYKKELSYQAGIILMVQFDPSFEEYVAWVESEGKRILIPASELELFSIRGNLNHYVGQQVTFVDYRFDTKRNLYIGSCRPVKEQLRDQLIKALELGETFEATVTRLVYFGAYLTINGVRVILRNQDFSDDYTTVGDIHEVGDKIKVRLHRINQNQKINVEVVERHQTASSITIADFEPQTVVYGLIRSIKSWGCFVNIAPNLDAICPIPSQFKVYEGMKVAFKINQVRISESKVRGKIVRIIDVSS